MSKFDTSVKYNITQEAAGSKLEMGYLYLKNVPTTYAKVLAPAKKYQSDDSAYQMNIFINADTQEELEALGINKEMAEVDKTKIKKGARRGQLKYSSADEANADYAGMFAGQFSRDVLKRDKNGAVEKEYTPLKVVDTQGNPFTEEVGNGSIVSVKLFCYRNSEGMLNTMLDTVVVVEHVPYIRESSDGYDPELGITVKSPAKAPAIDPELQSSSGEAQVPVKAKSAPKAAPAVTDEDDMDAPF